MLKGLKQRWGPLVCSWVPLELWHRLTRMELLLPRYHLVGEQEPAHVKGLSIFRGVEQFKTDIEFFLRSYVPVNLQDIVSHLDGSSQLPRRCFLPTFDDGFREIHDVVEPILTSEGIPAVFFLNPSVLDNNELLWDQKKSLLISTMAAVEDSPQKGESLRILTNAGVKGQDLPSRIRSIPYCQRHLLDELGLVLACDFEAYVASVEPYLTSDQTRGLIRKGFAIGGHSVDHALYTELSVDEQLAQTRASVAHLSEHFQYECQSFAFPYRDTGVLPSFFEGLYGDGRIKVTFGSDGMHHHFHHRNLERFKMEYPGLRASQILAREFFLFLSRKPSWVDME